MDIPLLAGLNINGSTVSVLGRRRIAIMTLHSRMLFKRSPILASTPGANGLNGRGVGLPFSISVLQTRARVGAVLSLRCVLIREFAVCVGSADEERSLCARIRLCRSAVRIGTHQHDLCSNENNQTFNS